MAPTPEASSVLSGRRVSVLGCGAVGSALAGALAPVGAQLTLWSRASERAQALAGRLAAGAAAPTVDAGTVEVRPDLDASLSGAWCVLIAVADGALEEVAGRLAALAPSAGTVFVHTSGARGLDALASLRAAGCEVAKLHPLVAVPPRAIDEPRVGVELFRDAWFASAGTTGAAQVLAALLRALGGNALRLGPQDAAASLRVHTAAALLSGGLVALFDAALEVAAEAETPRAEGVGVDRAELERALLGLVASTLGNLSREPAAASLTGPAARGAVEVVRSHLETLEHGTPEVARLYRLLSRRMLALAVRRGSLPQSARAELGRLLAD